MDAGSSTRCEGILNFFIYTVSVARFIELCLDRHYSVELGLYFTVLLSGFLSLNLLSMMMMMMMGAIQAVPTVPAT